MSRRSRILDRRRFLAGGLSLSAPTIAWRSDYRIVPYVTRPDAPISTRASFDVEDGVPGARQLP